MAILPIDSKRYGSKNIRRIFDEIRRLEYQLRVEGAIAQAQGAHGVIPKSAALEIKKKAVIRYVSIKDWREEESRVRHETAALVEVLSTSCTKSTKPWIHYSLTSNDILDTSMSLQIKDAIEIIDGYMVTILKVLKQKAKKYRSLPSVGRTHGQHASVMAFGLKFASWLAEFSRHSARLEEAKRRVLVCKTLGVIGTGSVMGVNALAVQKSTAKLLGLSPVMGATQIVPRDLYAEVTFLVALIGSSLDKIAVELRNLQRTEIGEVEEPFEKGQIGSSAVPSKRNPAGSERVSSLARLLRAFPEIELGNIPLWHERDLSNSANERFVIPMAFILLDEMLTSMIHILKRLEVNEKVIQDNINISGGKIFSEFILDRLIRKGVARSKAHALLREVTWESINQKISFNDALRKSKNIKPFLKESEIRAVIDPKKCLGASTQIIDEIVHSVEKTCHV